MKFGDLLVGTVTRMDDKGRGVMIFAMPNPQDGTRDVVIPFTAIGDTVEAKFVRRERGMWIAELTRVITPSQERVDTPCSHAGTCGGCLWQHLSYDAQLALKLRAINTAFERAGHTERVDRVMPSHDQLHYRNRMDYVFGWKGELGLKQYGSWSRYLDLSTCFLLDEQTPEILKQARETFARIALAPWDAKKHTGDVRYLVIRLGRNTNERLVMIVVKDASAVTPMMRDALVSAFDGLCTSLLLGENALITDLSYVQSYDVLFGNPLLSERVNEITYAIHPNSFFQTNTAMASELQNAVLEAIPSDTKHVLDLYCGLGFFGIACAKRGMSVYGHELDAHAIDLAKRNADANGVAKRCVFASGPVEQLDWSGMKADVVIVDPPRSGLHPNAISAILKNAPKRLIYVSCNYHSFVKELSQLKTLYTVSSVRALDLFPQTPHVELVTILDKI